MRTVILSLICMTVLGGCVLRGRYNDALAELATSAGQNETLSAQRQALVAIYDQLSFDQTELMELLSMTQTELSAEIARLQQELTDTQALLSQSSSEAQELMARLEQLAMVEEELRARNAFYDQFLDQFRGLIDQGLLSIRIERGRIVLGLPQDILFASGSAELEAAGTAALQQIGVVIATIDRGFQVEGHTDNVPISTTRYPSNWELSTARALAVVHVFVATGVGSENVSAAGFGEHHPRGPNATPTGRATNRRIEIVMLPNLDIFSGDI